MSFSFDRRCYLTIRRSSAFYSINWPYYGESNNFFCSVFHSCRCIDVFTIKKPSFTQKDPFFDKIIMQLKRFRCGIAECACVSGGDGWFFFLYLYIFARRKVGSKSNGKLLKTEWNQFADPFLMISFVVLTLSISVCLTIPQAPNTMVFQKCVCLHLNRLL